MATKENKIVTVPYGLSHTKCYNPSVVVDYLVEKDDTTGEVCINSDIHLLLRQKTLQRRIGLDLLRDYVNNLEREQPQKHDFSDDELFKLIEPKGLNNITTAYQFAKYLQSSSESVKNKYEALKREKETFKSLFDKYVNPKT